MVACAITPGNVSVSGVYSTYIQCLHCEMVPRARGMDGCVWVLWHVVRDTTTCSYVHGCVDACILCRYFNRIWVGGIN